MTHDDFWEKVVEMRFRASKRLREYGEMLRDDPGSKVFNYDLLRAEADYTVAGQLLQMDKNDIPVTEIDLMHALAWLRSELVRLSEPTGSLMAACKNEAYRQSVSYCYVMVGSVLKEVIKGRTRHAA